MAASPRGKTYRVQGIPAGFDKIEIGELICLTLDEDGVLDIRPTVHSLCPNPQPCQSSCQTATVSFEAVPQRLLDTQEECSLLKSGDPNNEGHSSSVTIDSHFRGFTPLNFVKDGEHIIEYKLQSPW
jgi:hypothetical protein